MTETFPVVVGSRWRPGARFLTRTGRRTLVESLYLLTAPATAAAGLLLVLGGLCVGTVGSLLPGRSRLVLGGLVPARWFADLERWRIATVRPSGRRADGAICAMAGLLFVLPLLFAPLGTSVQNAAQNFLPHPMAATSLTAVKHVTGALPPWLTFGLLCGYAAAALASGAWALARRDA